MDTEIGVGLIVGAVTGSSIYIWNSEHFTKSQKTFLLICIIFPPAQWVLAILIYFFNETTSSEKSNLSRPLTYRSQQNQNNQRNFSTDEQKQSLKILKDKGLLNETEYKEKIDIINEQIIIEKIRKLSEYRNLKNVYESELLTKEQFDEKTNKLIADYKEYYSIFGENHYPEFTWELFKVMKLNKKINPYDYENSHFFGRWTFKDGQLFLYKEQNLSKNKIKISWTNGLNKNGEWELERQQLNVKLDKKSNFKQLNFRIDELGSHILVYYIDENKYTCIKNSFE